MVAFLYRMGVSIPGRLTSSLVDSTIEPNYNDPNNPVGVYGVPVVLNANGTGVNPVSAATTAAQIWGVLLQPFPEQAASAVGSYGQQQLSDPNPAPPTKAILAILKRGRCGVAVNSGSAAAAQKGGQVYVWVAATQAGHTQGLYEATDSPGNTVALSAYFDGPCDSNGFNEIALAI